MTGKGLYQAIFSYDHSQVDKNYIEYINEIILEEFKFQEFMFFELLENNAHLSFTSLNLDNYSIDISNFTKYDLFKNTIYNKELIFIEGDLLKSLHKFIVNSSPNILDDFDRIIVVNVSNKPKLEAFILLFLKDDTALKQGEIEKLEFISSFLKPVYRNYCIEKEAKENISLFKEQEEELNIIFNSVPAIIFYKDLKKRLIRVNDAYVKKIGLSREQIYMKKDQEFFPKEDANNYNKDDDKVIKEGKVLKNIVEKIDGPNGPIWVRTDKVPFRDLNGNITGLIGVSIDITEIKNVEERLKLTNKELQETNAKLIEIYEELSASEEELRSQNEEIVENRKMLSESEERYRMLIENAEDAIFNIDYFANFISVNEAFETVFDLSRKEIIGKNLSSFVNDKENYNNWYINYKKVINTCKTVKSIYKYINRSGEERTYELTLLPVKSNGSITNIIGTNHDITDLIAKERKIKKLAYYDEITGIYNRTFFKEKGKDILNKYLNSGEKLGFFFIDLDNFKKINDTQGHQVGDLLLKEMAERLKKIFADSILIARMGGDEFAVIHKMNTNVELKSKASKILNIIREPCKINGLMYYLSCSVGISIFPDHGKTFEDLLKYADTAMYKAKEANKNTYKIFNKDMMKDSERKLELETELRNALEKGEMDIHYQAIIESYTGNIIGFEALMRWNSNIFDKVPPSVFIPILEETGLIIPFGEWIMLNACKQTKQWQKKFSKDYYISVNVSPIQLKHKDFLNSVKKILDKCNLSPENLEIEITESIFIEDMYTAINKLKELQSIGVRIALDDFGTGYSSLNYLRTLPINKIKIDKSFVDEIGKELSKESVLGSVISLAHDMKLKVLAEGVETKAQEIYLKNKSCDYLQGYYYSKPCEANHIDNIL
ncbi:sensor domain-containing protein [Natronospora cellulosivora (SeqCode)]